MKAIFKALLCILTLLSFNSISAQIFTDNVGGNIRDGGPEVCFPITVTGVGTIDANYGVASVCINISHPFDGDLVIRLKAPDGTIVPLSTAIGGPGDNYTNTCFTGTASQPISQGTPPYTGTFLPQGFLGAVNNGQNADGDWSLCVRDRSRPDSGKVVSWSIVFNNTPAPQPPPPPVNDDPCSAFRLGVKSSCNYSTYSTYAASATTGVPNPPCANYQGGDVWFKVVVPPNGIMQIDTKEGIMTDGGMAAYKGPSCSALTMVRCDDNSSANGQMPMLILNSLTPGDTIWIRVWARSNINTGTFGICVTTPPPMPSCSGNPPAGNTCAVATQICNNEGFCGNTSSSYTIDVWPELVAAFNCGSIQNNSFLKFIAAANSASFYVWVLNSNQPNGGIQLMIYDGGCGSGAVNRYTCIQRIGPSNGVPTLVSATGLTAGNTYYIMVDGFSGTVCDYVIAPNTGTSVLTVNPINSASPEICAGHSVELNASGGNNTYVWSPAAGLNKTTGDTVIASPDTTTTYTITSTAPAGCNGTVTAQITVTVHPKPALGADTTATFCAGSSLDLTALYPTAGPGAQWTINGVAVANPVAVKTPGKYVIIATNSTGCTDTAAVTVTRINKLNLGADKTIVICPNKTADLTAVYNTTGLSTVWTKAGAPVANPASVPAGVYRLIVNDGASCPDTAIVTVNNYVITPAPPQKLSICPSQIPFTWNGKQYTAAGTYTDTLRSAAGCDSVVTLQLTIKLNSSSVTNKQLCPAQLPFLWNGTRYTTGGTFYDTIINAAGCDSLLTLILDIIPNTSSTTNITICQNATPYSWNGNQYDSTGTYSVRKLGASGCDSIATLVLEVKPNPPAPAADANSPVCTGDTLRLTASDIPGATYKWFGPGGFTASQQQVNVSPVVMTTAGNYSVFATVNGCAGPRDTAAVTVIETPVVSAGPDKQVSEGDTVYLNPQVNGSVLTYRWSPLNYLLTPDTVLNAAVLGIANMTYYLTATSNGTCTAKADGVYVKVLPRTKPFTIPSAFSPNNDGINDTWILKDLVAYPGATVDVYSRYGAPVFSSIGYKKAWDGTSNGVRLPEGTYYFIIKLNEKLKPMTGNVTILR